MALLKVALLKDLESGELGQSVALETLLDVLPYDDHGLIAAIAQDQESAQVLMLGWMDREAITRTLQNGQVCYYSRSRQTYWVKGETSGHTQQLIDMRFDCDGDAILLTVAQTGPACHTNRSNCFYLQVRGDQVTIASEPQPISNSISNSINNSISNSINN